MEAGDLVVVVADDSVFRNIIPFRNGFGIIELHKLARFNMLCRWIYIYHFYIVFHARVSNPL